MIGTVLPEHPKQTLLFFVASGLDEAIKTEMRNFVLGLADVTTWTLGPPLFVDEYEEPRDVRSGDLATQTVGGSLQIYTALPPWRLAREIDLQHLREVELLVTRLRDFSRDAGLEVEFELDGKFVGSIANGEMDTSLSVGLMREWRRRHSL